jgi:hypothetical protein
VPVEIDGLGPCLPQFIHDHAQARVGPAVSWPGGGGHGVAGLPGRIVTQAIAGRVEIEALRGGGRLVLTFRGAVPS